MKIKVRAKRHFQLLELMIAIFILLICIAPAMRVFTHIFRSQQEIVRENLRNHLTHMVHAKFTEMLYKREVSFEGIKEKKQMKKIDITDTEILQALKEAHFACEGNFSIVSARKTGEQDKPNRFLCKLDIEMKDTLSKNPEKTTSEYYIYIDAQNKDQNNAPPTQEALQASQADLEDNGEGDDDDDADDGSDDGDDDGDDNDTDEDDDK